MAPLIVIPLLLGWLLARRLLEGESLLHVLGLTGGLAVVLTLMGVNGCLRTGFSLTWAILATLSVQAVACGVLLDRGRAAPPWIKPGRWTCLAMLVLTLVVLFYSNAHQIANPDDDYWIHAPLQGLMLKGHFPLFNPYFENLPMNGHYGRNLGVVVVARLLGTDVFWSQHLVTSALQVLTLWAFFGVFRRATGSDVSALLATGFLFFGVNAGARGGLIDTLQNNNPFVHLYLALLLGFALDVWQRGSWAGVVLGGLTLGSYGIVYETHFGLVFCTILGLTPLLYFRGAISKKRALMGLGFLLVSLPPACTQGGPLTDLLERRLQGREHSQAETLSKGMQNQAQVVKFTFPKDDLFQIKLEMGEYQRVAHIYRMDTPLRALYQPSTERGYAYIWSWQVLRMHFLPLYLLPLSFFVLWRRRHLAGLFMGAFGVIAYLTPALVDFGPIYESEYYRWEFAASLGFAACLGLTLGAWLEETPTRPFGLLSASVVGLTGRGRRAVVVGLLALLNSWTALHYVGERLAVMKEEPSRWLFFPSTERWLSEHAVFGFERIDLEAARWLEQRVEPGQRLLTNFRQENGFSIYYESTLTGLAGIACVGHSLPLEDERIGTTPFRRNPAAEVFWNTYRPEPLRQMQVDWVLYRANDGVEPPPVPGGRLEHRIVHGDRLRLIYRINREELVPEQVAEEGASSRVVVRGFEVPEPVRGGRMTTVTLTLDGEPDGGRLKGLLEFFAVRWADGYEHPQTLRLQVDQLLSPEGELELKLPLVPPHDEGEYTLRSKWTPLAKGESLALPERRLKVQFEDLLEKASVKEVDLPGRPQVWPPGRLVEPQVKLTLPKGLPQPRDVLAYWLVTSSETEQQEPVYLRRVELTSTLSSLPLVTPSRPGRYSLELCLSPRHGKVIRLYARQLTVR